MKAKSASVYPLTRSTGELYIVSAFARSLGSPLPLPLVLEDASCTLNTPAGLAAPVHSQMVAIVRSVSKIRSSYRTINRGTALVFRFAYAPFQRLHRWTMESYVQTRLLPCHFTTALALAAAAVGLVAIKEARSPSTSEGCPWYAANGEGHKGEGVLTVMSYRLRHILFIHVSGSFTSTTGRT